MMSLWQQIMVESATDFALRAQGALRVAPTDFGLSQFKDTGHAYRRPFNAARGFREREQSTLHSQAQPSQKPFFVSFNNGRRAADSEHWKYGPVFIQSCTKPLGPFWDSRQAVNLRQRHPQERGIGVRQDRSPCAAGVI